MPSPLRFTAPNNLAAHATTAGFPEFNQSGGSIVAALGVCGFQIRLVSPSDGSGRDHASSQSCWLSVIFTAMSVSGAHIVASLNVQTCHSD